MLRTLAISFLISFGNCTTVSWANEPLEPPTPPEWTDESLEETIGKFDEEGRLHNETEKTYRLPAIGVFAGYFPESHDLSTGLSVEISDRYKRHGLFRNVRFDLVVAEQKIGLSAGYVVFPVVDITAMTFFVRDFDRNEYTWGLGFGIIKF